MRDYGKNEVTPQDAQESILSPITKALTTNNITLDRLTAKLSKLIDCKKTIGVNSKGKPIQAPDNTNQLNAVKDGFKLHRAYPADKIEIEGDTGLTIRLVQYGVIEDRDETDKHKEIEE